MTGAPQRTIREYDVGGELGREGDRIAFAARHRPSGTRVVLVTAPGSRDAQRLAGAGVQVYESFEENGWTFAVTPAPEERAAAAPPPPTAPPQGRPFGTPPPPQGQPFGAPPPAYGMGAPGAAGPQAQPRPAGSPLWALAALAGIPLVGIVAFLAEAVEVSQEVMYLGGAVALVAFCAAVVTARIPGLSLGLFLFGCVGAGIPFAIMVFFFDPIVPDGALKTTGAIVASLVIVLLFSGLALVVRLPESFPAWAVATVPAILAGVALILFAKGDLSKAIPIAVAVLAVLAMLPIAGHGFANRSAEHTLRGVEAIGMAGMATLAAALFVAFA